MFRRSIIGRVLEWLLRPEEVMCAACGDGYIRTRFDPHHGCNSY